MAGGFSIDVGSDQDHEDLVAEIYYEGEFVAMITQEDGVDRMQFEIHPRRDGEPWLFLFSDFQDAVQSASRRLWELRRVDDVGGEEGPS